MVQCVVTTEVGLGWGSSLVSHGCRQAWMEEGQLRKADGADMAAEVDRRIICCASSSKCLVLIRCGDLVVAKCGLEIEKKSRSKQMLVQLVRLN